MAKPNSNGTGDGGEFRSVLKKNAPRGRPPAVGLSLTMVFMQGLEYFRFTLGEPIIKRAGFAEMDLLDLQLDDARRLGRIARVIVTGEGRPVRGNRLTTSRPAR